MDLALVRTEFRADGIFSELRDPAGEMLFVTLEHSYPDGLDGFAPKVVDGVYTCKRRLSPAFGYELFQIMDVPNCTYIEIHIGNFQGDSKGCVLLGTKISQINEQQVVTHSKEAFKAFMALQTGYDEFMLTVRSS